MAREPIGYRHEAPDRRRSPLGRRRWATRLPAERVDDIGKEAIRRLAENLDELSLCSGVGAVALGKFLVQRVLDSPEEAMVKVAAGIAIEVGVIDLPTSSHMQE